MMALCPCYVRNAGPCLTRSSSDSSTSAKCSSSLAESDSEAGVEEDKIVRKTLFYLVSTLNASFYPDYDFSNATSKEFSKEHSLQGVMRSVERQLQAHSELTSVCDKLWSAIDEAVSLAGCEIYTYNPDENSDPYSDDVLWSFNYFFYNARLKRIVFLTCRRITSLLNTSSSADYGLDSDVDFDD
ncbi:hypothetical protein HAZT_HAZT001879 [Hyalella azteca]|nr:hypothetical protein HAZT_HAZT001879 [Hyalella azteca]